MLDNEAPAHLTRPQWGCLSDAREGKTIAATKDTLQVLSTDATGAVLHHARIIKKLAAADWLRPIDDQHWVITDGGRAALRQLRVRPEGRRVRLLHGFAQQVK